MAQRSLSPQLSLSVTTLELVLPVAWGCQLVLITGCSSHPASLWPFSLLCGDIFFPHEKSLAGVGHCWDQVPQGWHHPNRTVPNSSTVPGQEGVNAHSALSSQLEGRLEQKGDQPPRWAVTLLPRITSGPPPIPKKSQGCIRTVKPAFNSHFLKEIHPSLPEFTFHSMKVTILQNKLCIQIRLA